MARRSQACGLLPMLIGLSLLGVSCGGSTTQSSTTQSSNGQTSGSSQPTKVQHVFMVMEENQPSAPTQPWDTEPIRLGW